MDTDNSGGISFEEFVAMMQLGEVETDFEKEIKEAFKFFDKDGDGEVGPPLSLPQCDTNFNDSGSSGGGRCMYCM